MLYIFIFSDLLYLLELTLCFSLFYPDQYTILPKLFPRGAYTVLFIPTW